MKRRDFLKAISFTAASLMIPGCSAGSVLTKFGKQKPNFLFILADDLGYGDLSCFGQQHFQTPHLDEMAWEFFATETVLEAIREKVAALYPEHEVERFTELFWNRVQEWRRTEGAPA